MIYRWCGRFVPAPSALRTGNQADAEDSSAGEQAHRRPGADPQLR